MLLDPNIRGDFSGSRQARFKLAGDSLAFGICRTSFCCAVAVSDQPDAFGAVLR